MQTGVYTHVCVADLPIHDRLHRITRADFRQRGARKRHMKHGTVVFPASGGFNCYFGTTAQTQHARVTWLSTANRIEHGSIEHDAFLAEFNDARIATFEIGVLVKK